MLLIIVVLSTSSCKFVFRGPIKPDIKIKAENIWESGKKVIKHVDKVAEVANIALGMANLDPEGWVNWKNLKKLLLPDLKTLTEKMVSYGPKLDHLYSILDTLKINMKSETLMRTNLTNVVGKVQESIKMANSSALKAWTTIRKLHGMSLKNEVLGGLGAAGSSFLLFCVILISYIKYTARMKLRRARKFRKMASAMVRSYIEDQQPQTERFQDVTDDLQLVRTMHAQVHTEGPDGAQAQLGQQQGTVEGSAQQNESNSFLSKIF